MATLIIIAVMQFCIATIARLIAIDTTDKMLFYNDTPSISRKAYLITIIPFVGILYVVYCGLKMAFRKD